MIARRLLAAAAVLAVTAGCTSSGGPRPGPAATSSKAAAELTALAGRGAAATYTGFYSFHQVTPNSTATVDVWHAPPNLRVDVVAGGTTASFIRRAAATYSCASKKGKLSCFTVAGRGQKPPAPFDVGPATLFSDDLVTLSASGASYDVTTAAPVAASGSIPAATCFAVKSGLLTPQPAVQAATYCFADNGVLTSVTYPSGNTARLFQLLRTVPPKRFVPYATPRPLPS
ncbi:MAG: hypothetical protein JO079_05290 [Frankiaceae bacterium]|nr:hypothetical protein [Frankiaceae bacterium]